MRYKKRDWRIGDIITLYNIRMKVLEIDNGFDYRLPGYILERLSDAARYKLILGVGLVGMG